MLELEANPVVVHTIDDDISRDRLHEWLQADPKRREAFALLERAIELIAAPKPADDA